MAIDINSKHALAVDARQLRRERKAYRQRIGVAQGLQRKLDSLEFNSRPLRLDNQEYMLLRMLLASDVHVQGRVVKWIDARLRALMTSLPT
jgi:hypothetical protein